MANLQSFQNLPINPISGTFGNGKILLFANSGTFTTPTGITAVRVRCFGAGQSSAGTCGGGGFAMKTITSGLTATVAVTVGINGGTSSFGAYVSATGGAAGVGGNGVGGDVPYNNRGGDGMNNAAGGVASIWGNGGGYVGANNMITGASGYGGNVTTPGTHGGSGFSGSGGSGGNGTTSTYNPPTAGILSSIDFIGTGGGAGIGPNSNTTGVNGGGGNANGAGGYPGGGGGTFYRGGDGLVIVEY